MCGAQLVKIGARVRAGVGNWLLLGISFAIIITTQQRRHAAERHSRLMDQSVEVHLLRRIWAFIERHNFLSAHYWQQRAQTLASPVSDASSRSDDVRDLGPESPPAVQPIPLSLFWSSQVETDAEKQEERNGQNSANAPSWCAETRATAAACLVSRPYRCLKMISVLLSCAGLMLERPTVTARERESLQFIYVITTVFFLWDFALRLLGFGVWHYLSSVYNILDFLALFASMWDQVASLSDSSSSETGGSLATGSSYLAVARCFHAIGAPRLFFSAGSTPMEHVMYLAVEQAVPQMLPTTLLVMGVFTGFSVLGQHILSGKMHVCSDPIIFTRQDCQGFDQSGAPRSWDLLAFNFGWFGAAMESVWVIAASNDWPELM